MEPVNYVKASQMMDDAASALGSTRKAVTKAVREFGNLPRPTTVRMLGALQGKHVYAGTVPAATVAKRRAANKVARRQRRVNNLHNFRHGVR